MSALLVELRKYRKAIGYTLDDIKGISPDLCIHRIHLEDERCCRGVRRQSSTQLGEVPFMVREGIVLGHKISEKGIELDRAKVDVMLQLPVPKTVKDIKEFSGSCRVLQKIHQGFLKDSKTLDKASVQGDRF
ncbi:unnamed protein product [Microthlaspi erraticum]|uniref:Uncharacterized protein n=1 Tax=Microthlaspi erraticum TaxID=1685480 RepID=A0A6D2HNV9_9BRAS|nr:unnamed protein product [Microthlaspi erraticum]